SFYSRFFWRKLSNCSSEALSNCSPHIFYTNFRMYVHNTHIFFSPMKILEESSCLSYSNKQNAGNHWVECPKMPCLFDAENFSHPKINVMRCWPFRLVYIYKTPI